MRPREPDRVRAGLVARLIWTAGLICVASGLAAQDMDRSIRPMANPIYASAQVEAEAAPVPASAAPKDALAQSLRPMPRPEGLDAKVAAMQGVAAPEPGLDLSTAVQEPELAAAAPPPSKKEKRKKKREAASMQGAVCGVAAIKGEVIAPITSKVDGCGVPEAVRVISISGVRLSQGATIDCATATALNTWVEQVLQPAYGGDVVELQVAAHYICRSRNNIKGAKISEHGRGKAIDIAAFVMSSGKVLTVEDDFNKTMRKVHAGACGLFKTTLGPGSDGYHEDHLHFDTSSRKGGAYCR
jgi:hypothetical protein